MKKLVFCLAFAVLFGISSVVVMAYLVSDDQICNEISLTDTEITVTEEFDPPDEIHPGTVIKKIPTITNLSDSPCYVRIAYYFSDQRAEQFCEEMQILDGWTLKEDGYYYWKDELAPHASTSPLFDHITIRKEVPQESLSAFEVLIYAEAVTSTGFQEGEAWEQMK